MRAGEVSDMDTEYFSDRELGLRSRVEEEISPSAWSGILGTIQSRIADNYFGYRYPLGCPDGLGPYGFDESLFYRALKAEIPNISQPFYPGEVPPTLAVLDLIEFCHRAVGKPVQTDYHSFYRHHHLRFEPEEGQGAFRDDINRILSRNGLAYELKPNGEVDRLAPVVLREALASVVFRTGDTDLDSLLEAARTKYLNPSLTVRQESLEKLWAAWERLKTIEPGKDKKVSATALLKKAAAEPNFYKRLYKRLEGEAHELTDIGNKFRIRHSETDKVSLELSEHVDYLFHRLFALIRLLLRTTGRGG